MLGLVLVISVGLGGSFFTVRSVTVIGVLLGICWKVNGIRLNVIGRLFLMIMSIVRACVVVRLRVHVMMSRCLFGIWLRWVRVRLVLREILLLRIGVSSMMVRLILRLRYRLLLLR